MTTLAIEQADDFQTSLLGNLKKKNIQIKQADEEQRTVDYQPFFEKNPHYRTDNKKSSRSDKFISHDGNSILTVKTGKITAENKNGEPDIKAMLDLAEANGWQSIKFPKFLGKGSKEYRQAVWLEAKRRGIEVENYKPTKLEEQHLSALLANDKKEQNQPLEIVPKDNTQSVEKNLEKMVQDISGSLNKKDKVLQANALSQKEAHNEMVGVLNEFFPFDSPNYNDAEQKISDHLAEIYSKGGAVTHQQIKSVREQFKAMQPKIRQEYYQATQHEQSKMKTDELSHKPNKDKELVR